MIYIVIGLIVVIAATILGVSGAKVNRKSGSSDTYVAASAAEGTSKCENDKESSDNSTSIREAEIDTTKDLTRVEVEKLLRVLAESPSPKDLRPIGATCYAMMIRHEATYVCPKCGEKTLYSSRWVHLVRSIPGCRRVLKTIVQIPIELDESQFCKKCSPEIESPELCLLLRYRGEEIRHRICAVSLEDLTLLSEFLAGKDRHVHWDDRETALKAHVERLADILNVEVRPDSSEQEGETENEHE